MTSTLRQTMDALADWAEPRRTAGNPFRLICRLELPAEASEVDSAWPGLALPSEVADFWTAARSAELFLDVDYGQWGLRLLAPAKSAGATATATRDRPGEFRSGDVVFGRFVGDQELLVIESSGSVLVALPLDNRKDWPMVGESLPDFLARYVAAHGDKYWEARPPTT
jgi:hypothetical protein